MKTNLDFVFGKIQFTELFSEQAINEFMETIKSAEEKGLEKNEWVWRIGGVKKQTIDGRVIIYGRLGKILKSKIDTVYDEKEKDFVETTVFPKSAMYSAFVFDKSTYIIAIEETYQISRGTFVKRLKEFVDPISKDLFSVEFLTDKIDVYKEIEKWDRVEKATFQLHPTNPSSDPDFSKLDEMILKSGAENANFNFKSDESKSLAKKDSVIQEGIAMSSAGYGNFTIHGISKKEKKKIKKKGAKLIRKILDITDEPLQLMNQIVDFIKSLKN